MNKEEYIIINKTQLLKRIEELSFIGKSQGLTEYQFAEKSVTENIISQSTPLIPENINKILSIPLGSEEK